MLRHRRALVALGFAVAAVVTFDAWLLTCGFQGCPSSEQIRAYRPGEGGRILDRNGRMMGRLAIVRRINVPITDVPLHVQQAFIATEDRRFYEHGGFDWRALFRATARNLAAFRVREGFSTITMQVARNTFLADRYNGRSLRRKFIELRLARLLERELDKDQILELYLNAIYLGNGVYGVEAASRDLFGKSVNRVSLAEGALLAALPKAPSSYTPRRNRERALARRNLVLTLMEREGYLTGEQVEAATRQPLRVASQGWKPSVADEPSAIDAVRAFVDSVLPDALKEGDIVVHTTLDADLQRAADRVVVRQTAAITRETAASGRRPMEGAPGRLRGDGPRDGRPARRGHRPARAAWRLQPRVPRAPSARVRVQALRLCRGARPRALAGVHG
jgi:membrane peptidoglycan carboxypeptidase